MAKKATAKTKSSGKKAATAAHKPGRAVATTGARRSTGADEGGMGEAFIKLLQSPLVADLLAVAATAALAALAEHGFSNHGGSDGGGKRAGRAVKLAGKAAAAAIGRRLGTEVDEIRSAARAAKARATK